MMISVCIASYNGELFIKEQIASILSQLDDKDELIISDDCSSDNTTNIISSFGDSRIILIKNDKRKGVIKNFETAISQAKGEYIFIADQDDIWLPNKVEISINKIKQIEANNPNKPVLIFSDAKVVDKNLNIIIPSIFLHTKQNPDTFGNPDILCVANRILGCTMVFNKKTKDICLPIQNDAIMHDWWIALSVAKHKGIIKPIPESIILYRQHNNNLIGSNLIQKTNKIFQLKSLFKLNCNIYKMSSHFFKLNYLKYLILKIRLHI